MTRLGTRGNRLGLMLGMVCLLLASTNVMAQLAERQVFSLGTASTDGVSHPLGVTIAALIKLKLLPQSNIDLDARNTEGSRDNAERIRGTDLDFAILSGFDAYHAARGTGPFVDQGADPTLRVVTNLWTSSFHFLVKPEHAVSGRFEDILNLKGRRLALGEQGSDRLNQARGLFAPLDVDIDDDFELVDLDQSEAVDALIAGEIDGFLLVDDRQGDEIAAFLEAAGSQAVLLDLTEDDLEAIGGRDALPWARIDMPGRALPGATNDHVTIGLRNLLGTSERLSDDIVYRITGTIFDNLLFLQEMDPATVGISLETALDQLPMPIHAGAETYYREVGVTLPDVEPVRVSKLSQTPFLNRYDTVQAARTRLSDRTFTVLGGQDGQTSTRMISELSASLADTDLRIIGMTTPWPAENIADVLYAPGVDSAIVPLNVLDYALSENVYPGLQSKIAYTTELFAEEVHLIVSDQIQDLDDLVDRPVNLGLLGSTSEFTASFLLDRLNLPVEPVYDNDRTALQRLLRGEIAGAFIVSGKPAPAILEIPETARLRLLSLPPLRGDSYREATLSSSDYPNLVANGETIDTFGVRTMLLSYNWRTNNPRFQVLSNFIETFFDRLPAIQQQDQGHHTKWQEINPFRNIEGWIRSPAATTWINQQARPAEDRSATDG